MRKDCRTCRKSSPESKKVSSRWKTPFESGMKTLNQLDEELKGMNRRLTVLKDGKEEDLPGGENDEDL